MENIQIFDLAREEHKSELFGCMSVRWCVHRSLLLTPPNAQHITTHNNA
jgi:hypothetical protein